jgi:enterochelin esterase-like enzyme
MGTAVGARWDENGLTFRHADPDRALTRVRLDQHASLPDHCLEFGYDTSAGGWSLRIQDFAGWRLEYRLELIHPDGRVEVIPDPDNPHRVANPFGERSVVHRPGYVEPGWLHQVPAEGIWRELTISTRTLDADLGARIWSSSPNTDLVLVAHDGPEYDRMAALGHFSAAMIASGRIPPHHLVLLTPGRRNDWYSANPAYAKALARDVLPRVRAELGTTRPVVGMGASLGALAMLHAQRRSPADFEGLFLQSGSFFRPRLDPQESQFEWFRRIVRFTGRVVRSGHAPGRVPVVLTCGRVEENLANNREMTLALRRQGYAANLVEVPDAHNYTAWRDAFDPHLTALLQRVWAQSAAQASPGTGRT